MSYEIGKQGIKAGLFDRAKADEYGDLRQNHSEASECIMEEPRVYIHCTS